jgi:LysR family transcriptional regulator, glycine cleavage system transcriptional activator
MARLADLPPLTALRAFHAAGRHGSFQEAARELGVTPSAVSHQIRGLEEWLGTSLFHRMARRVELTKPGRKFLAETERAFGRIETAARALRAQSGATRLKVSALPLFTTAWLIPRLARFEARHPDIVLDVETANRIVDFDREDVDVAIRNLRSPTPGLVARKLLDVSPIPVCAAKLAATLKTPADLASHTIIHVTARRDAWPSWLNAVGLPRLKPKRELSFDTVPAAVDAAARGHGVALGMHPIVWESPSAANLVVPFAPKVPGDASYYVVHRKADRARPPVQAFVNWLTKEMAAFERTRRKLPMAARRGG